MTFLITLDFARILVSYLQYEDSISLQEAVPIWHTVIARKLIANANLLQKSRYCVSSQYYADPINLLSLYLLNPFHNIDYPNTTVYTFKFLWEHCKDKLTLDFINTKLIMHACCLADEEFIHEIIRYPGFDISKIPYTLHRMYIRNLLGDPLCQSVNKQMIIGRNKIPPPVDIEAGFKYYKNNKQRGYITSVYHLKYLLGKYFEQKNYKAVN